MHCNKKYCASFHIHRRQRSFNWKARIAFSRMTATRGCSTFMTPCDCVQSLSSLCSCVQGICPEDSPETELCTTLKSLRQQFSNLESTFEKLKNDSEARLLNISAENANQKEEVDVLKKEQGRLRQNQSALQQEKESLKQRQETLTERQNMLSQYQDQKVSSLRSQLQQLRKNVTTEQEDLKDQLLRQYALLHQDVSQAEMKTAILERRFNISQTKISSLQQPQVRVSIFFVAAAVADVNGVTKRQRLSSFQGHAESKTKV